MVEMSVQHENSDANGVSGSGSCLYDLLCSETPSLNSQVLRDRWMSSGPQKRLDNLMRQAGNKYCADCGSSDPKWVLSLKLDEWTDEQVDALVNLGGNTVINMKRKYEFLQFLNIEENLSCPFVPSHARSSSSNKFPQDKKHYDKQATKSRIGSAFRNSWGRKDSEHKSSKKSNSLAGMVEFIGLIKVNVVKGTNLAIRDVMSSDPYVIISLGHQSVKTRVIKSSLNPIWNESLMLSIPDHIPPLKVLVYDKDTFSTDDFMGEAEIDIQPLVSAAKAYEKSSINESMQLGKWVASGDNTLVKDSIISLEEGKVKQEISVRLQHVERGVLEIELECVPLTQ
ncbi:putative ADP-ribosylation factor GTPase-activating protein AGD11 [Glycine max]|nr:putative ADP-ribosylation factor GTPase-activating protein AGD11 [Glycine max]